MTAAGIKRTAVYFLVNRVFGGLRCFGIKRILLNAIGHNLGKGTRLTGPLICTGTLVAGENCWLGRNLTIHGNGVVQLGNNCDIAPDVVFLTGGHRIGAPERRAGVGESYCICVEDGCWIGARASLLGDITVGRGSVVAACACVVEDVPANTLTGGVPARRIRKLHEES